MNSGELFALGFYGPIVFGFAIAVVLGFGAVLHFENVWRPALTCRLPILLLFAFAAATAVSGRNASLYGLGVDLISTAPSAAPTWVLRICTLTVVALSLVVIFGSFLRPSRITGPSRTLWLAFLGYYLSTHVVNGLLGTEFSISYKLLYPVVLIWALYVTSNEDTTRLLHAARDALLVFLVAGLLLLPFAPDLVAQSNYKGFFPYLSIRFWGLSSHANNLGPLALFFLILLRWKPYRFSSLNFLALAVAGSCLVLAQSKTALVTAAAVALVFMVRSLVLALRGAVRDRGARRSAFLAALVLAALPLLLLGLSILSLHFGMVEGLERRLQGNSSLLTGREYIWQSTLNEWRQNWWFGYGPELWSDVYAARRGLFGIASNAHNQFIDTLGSAGIFGILGLLVYLGVLSTQAFRLSSVTKGASLAFLVLILLRGVTEVPLEAGNIATSDFFMQAVIVGLFMRAGTAKSKVSDGST